MLRRLARRDRSALGHYLLGVSIASLLGSTAFAGPQGERVVSGQASFQRNGSSTVINVSDRAIINYNSFDIARGESVQFVQPGVSARVLNRIMGGAPTSIDGSLTANGQVYFVNPAGVVFGENAVVNVAALYAAAGNISDQDFLAGRDHFTNNTGSVINQGRIEASAVHFIGKEVGNYGAIVASEGLVTMVSGDDVYIGEEDGQVMLKLAGANAQDAVDAGSQGAAVTQAGQIDATGGEVLMAAGDVYGLAIHHQGQTRADHITVDAGVGKALVSGSLDASNATAGQQGGEIDVIGQYIELLDANIDASGSAGGGTIHIGGSYQGNGPLPNATTTLVDAHSVVNADAIEDGDGGTIIVWSDIETTHQGHVSSRGGGAGGNGGFIEISGKETLLLQGSFDISAPAGDGGTILFDPKNVTVSTGGGATTGQVADAGDTASNLTIDPATIDAAGGTVIINTTEDTIFTSPLDLGNGSQTLEVFAGRDVLIQASITATAGTNELFFSAGRDIVLSSGMTIGGSTHDLAVRFQADGIIDTTLGSIETLNSVVLQAQGNVRVRSISAGGPINLEASAPDLLAPGGSAVEVVSTALVSSSTDRITMIADDFQIAGDATISAADSGNGLILLAPSTEGKALNVGQMVGAHISNTALPTLSAGVVVIIGNAQTAGFDADASTVGDATERTAGDITFDQANIGNRFNLDVISSGFIEDVGDGVIHIQQATNLYLEAGGGIGQTTDEGLSLDAAGLSIRDNGAGGTSALLNVKSGTGSTTFDAFSAGNDLVYLHPNAGVDVDVIDMSNANLQMVVGGDLGMINPGGTTEVFNVNELILDAGRVGIAGDEAFEIENVKVLRAYLSGPSGSLVQEVNTNVLAEVDLSIDYANSQSATWQIGFTNADQISIAADGAGTMTPHIDTAIQGRTVSLYTTTDDIQLGVNPVQTGAGSVALAADGRSILGNATAGVDVSSNAEIYLEAANIGVTDAVRVAGDGLTNTGQLILNVSGGANNQVTSASNEFAIIAVEASSSLDGMSLVFDDGDSLQLGSGASELQLTGLVVNNPNQLMAIDVTNNDIRVNAPASDFRGQGLSLQAGDNILIGPGAGLGGTALNLANGTADLELLADADNDNFGEIRSDAAGYSINMNSVAPGRVVASAYDPIGNSGTPIEFKNLLEITAYSANGGVYLKDAVGTGSLTITGSDGSSAIPANIGLGSGAGGDISIFRGSGQVKLDAGAEIATAGGTFTITAKEWLSQQATIETSAGGSINIITNNGDILTGDLITVDATLGGGGNISLDATGGQVSTDDGVGSSMLVAETGNVVINADGPVTLGFIDGQAFGFTADSNVNVITPSTITANDDIILGGVGTVTFDTTSGTGDINVGDITTGKGTVNGGIFLSAGGAVTGSGVLSTSAENTGQANDGRVLISAAGNVSLGDIDTRGGADGGPVDIDSTGGTISVGNVNTAGANGFITLDAPGAITANDLITHSTGLPSGAGISVNSSAGSANLGNLQSGGGGHIIVSTDSALNVSSADTRFELGTGGVSLQVNGNGNLIVANSVGADNTVAISVTGIGDIGVGGFVDAGSGTISITNKQDAANNLTVSGLIDGNSTVTLRTGDTLSVADIGAATPTDLVLEGSLIVLTGDVTTAGQQNYQGPVDAQGDGTLINITSSSGNITFSNDLTANAFDVNVSAGGHLNATDVLKGTGGSAVSLTIGAGSDLTVDNIGASGTPFTSVTLTGGNNINVGNLYATGNLTFDQTFYLEGEIESTGNITFNGLLKLAGLITSVSSGPGDITFTLGVADTTAGSDFTVTGSNVDVQQIGTSLAPTNTLNITATNQLVSTGMFAQNGIDISAGANPAFVSGAFDSASGSIDITGSLFLAGNTQLFTGGGISEFIRVTGAIDGGHNLDVDPNIGEATPGADTFLQGAIGAGTAVSQIIVDGDEIHLGAVNVTDLFDAAADSKIKMAGDIDATNSNSTIELNAPIIELDAANFAYVISANDGNIIIGLDTITEFQALDGGGQSLSFNAGNAGLVDWDQIAFSTAKPLSVEVSTDTFILSGTHQFNSLELVGVGGLIALDGPTDLTVDTGDLDTSNASGIVNNVGTQSFSATVTSGDIHLPALGLSGDSLASVTLNAPSAVNITLDDIYASSFTLMSNISGTRVISVGSNIDIGGAPFQLDAQVFALANSLFLDATGHPITVNAKVDSDTTAQVLDVSASDGVGGFADVTITGPVGSLNPLADLFVEGANVELGAIQTNGQVNVTSQARTRLNGDVTVGNGGFINVQAGSDLFLAPPSTAITLTAIDGTIDLDAPVETNAPNTTVTLNAGTTGDVILPRGVNLASNAPILDIDALNMGLGGAFNVLDFDASGVTGSIGLDSNTTINSAGGVDFSASTGVVGIGSVPNLTINADGGGFDLPDLGTAVNPLGAVSIDVIDAGAVSGAIGSVEASSLTIDFAPAAGPLHLEGLTINVDVFDVVATQTVLQNDVAINTDGLGFIALDGFVSSNTGNNFNLTANASDGSTTFANVSFTERLGANGAYDDLASITVLGDTVDYLGSSSTAGVNVFAQNQLNLDGDVTTNSGGIALTGNFNGVQINTPTTLTLQALDQAITVSGGLTAVAANQQFTADAGSVGSINIDGGVSGSFATFTASADSVTVPGITVAETISLTGTDQIIANGDLATTAGSGPSIFVDGYFAPSGPINITSTGDISFTNFVDSNFPVTISGDTVNFGGPLSLSGGTGALDVTAATAVNLTTALDIFTAGDLRISGDVTAVTGNFYSIDGNISLDNVTADSIDLQSYGTGVSVTAGTLTATTGDISVTTDADSTTTMLGDLSANTNIFMAVAGGSSSITTGALTAGQGILIDGEPNAGTHADLTLGAALANDGNIQIRGRNLSLADLEAYDLGSTGGVISVTGDAIDAANFTADSDIAITGPAFISGDLLTNSGSINASGLLTLGAGTRTIEATSGAVTLAGGANPDTGEFVDLAVTAGSTLSTGDLGGTGGLDRFMSVSLTANTGTLTMANAYASGDINATAANGINAGGNVDSLAGSILFDGPVTLIAALTAQSSAASPGETITFTGTVDGNAALVVDGGSDASVNMDGAVGGTTAVLAFDAQGADINLAPVVSNNGLSANAANDLNLSGDLIGGATADSIILSAGNQILLSPAGTSLAMTVDDAINLSGPVNAAAAGVTFQLNADTATLNSGAATTGSAIGLDPNVANLAVSGAFNLTSLDAAGITSELQLPASATLNVAGGGFDMSNASLVRAPGSDFTLNLDGGNFTLPDIGTVAQLAGDVLIDAVDAGAVTGQINSIYANSFTILMDTNGAQLDVFGALSRTTGAMQIEANQMVLRTDVTFESLTGSPITIDAIVSSDEAQNYSFSLESFDRGTVYGNVSLLQHVGANGSFTNLNQLTILGQDVSLESVVTEGAIDATALGFVYLNGSMETASGGITITPTQEMQVPATTPISMVALEQTITVASDIRITGAGGDLTFDVGDTGTLNIGNIIGTPTSYVVSGNILSIPAVTVTDTISITGNDITLTGDLTTTALTGASITVSGPVTLSGPITVTTSGPATFDAVTGSDLFTVDADTAFFSGPIDLTAGTGSLDVTTVNGVTFTGASPAVNAAGNVTVSGLTTLVNGPLHSQSGDITLGDVTAPAGQNIDIVAWGTGATITTGNLSTTDGDVIVSAPSGAVNTSAGNATATGGDIVMLAGAGGIVTNSLTATENTGVGGYIDLDIAVESGGFIQVHSAAADTGVELHAEGLLAVISDISTTANDIDLSSINGSVSSGALTAPGFISAVNGAGSLTTEAITAGGPVTLTSVGGLGANDISGATVNLNATGNAVVGNTTATDGNITINANSLDAEFLHAQDQGAGLGGVSVVTASGDVQVNGIGAVRTVSVEAAGAILSPASTTISGSSVTLRGQGGIAVDDVTATSGDVLMTPSLDDITYGAVNITAGDVQGVNVYALPIGTTGNLTLASVTASGEADLDATQAITITDSTTAGNVNYQAGSDITLGAVTTNTGQLYLKTSGASAAINTGLLNSALDVLVIAEAGFATITTTGDVTAAGYIIFDTRPGVDGSMTGAIIVGGDVTATNGYIIADGASMTAGDLSADKPASPTNGYIIAVARRSLVDVGSVSASDYVELNAVTTAEAANISAAGFIGVYGPDGVTVGNVTSTGDGIEITTNNNGSGDGDIAAGDLSANGYVGVSATGLLGGAVSIGNVTTSNFLGVYATLAATTGALTSTGDAVEVYAQSVSVQGATASDYVGLQAEGGAVTAPALSTLSGQSVTLRGLGGINVGAVTATGTDVLLATSIDDQAYGDSNISTANLSSAGKVDFHALGSTGSVTTGAIDASGKVTGRATNGINTQAISNVDAAVDLQGGTITTGGINITNPGQALHAITLTATTGGTSTGQLTAPGDVNLTASNGEANTADVSATGGNISISADNATLGDLTATNTGSGTGAITINASGGAINIGGPVTGDGDVIASTEGLGSVLLIDGAVTGQNVLLHGPGDLTVGNGFGVTHDVTSLSGDVVLSTTQRLGSTAGSGDIVVGAVNSAAGVSVEALGSGGGADTGDITAGSFVDFDVDSAALAGAITGADATIDLQVGTLVAGDIQVTGSSGDIIVGASSGNANVTSYDAPGNISIDAAGVSNTSGSISGADIDLIAIDGINAGGITASGYIYLQTFGADGDIVTGTTDGLSTVDLISSDGGSVTTGGITASGQVNLDAHDEEAGNTGDVATVGVSTTIGNVIITGSNVQAGPIAASDTSAGTVGITALGGNLSLADVTAEGGLNLFGTHATFTGPITVNDSISADSLQTLIIAGPTSAITSFNGAIDFGQADAIISADLSFNAGTDFTMGGIDGDGSAGTDVIINADLQSGVVTVGDDTYTTVNPVDSITINAATMVLNGPLDAGTQNFNATLNIDGDIVLGTGDIVFTQNIVLTNNATLTAQSGNISLAGVSGPFDFTTRALTGTVEFSGDINTSTFTSQAALTRVNNVTTTGAQEFTGTVEGSGAFTSTGSGRINFSNELQLVGDVTIQTAGGFADTVHLLDGVSGGHSLSINSGSALVQFEGGAGSSTTPLETITIATTSRLSVGGDFHFNNLDLSSVGSFMELRGDTSLNSNGNPLDLTGQAIRSSPQAPMANFAINTGSGNLQLGQLGTSTNPIGQLDLTTTGTLELNGSLDVGSVDASGVTGGVALNTSVVINANTGGVNFGNASGIDGVTPGAQQFTINAGAVNVDLPAMGQNTPLGATTINASGATRLNGSVATLGPIAINGGTTLFKGDIELTSGGGDIDLSQTTLATDNDARDVHLNAGSGDLFLGDANISDPDNGASIGGLVLTSSGTTHLNGLIQADLIDLDAVTGDMRIDGDTTLHANGDVNFGNAQSLEGGATGLDLTVDAGNGVIRMGDTGLVTPMANLNLVTTNVMEFNSTIQADQAISLNGGLSRSSVPSVATAYKIEGNLVFRVLQAGGSVVVGQGEKLTVGGNLLIEADNVTVGDLTAIGDIDIVANNVTMMRRAGGGANLIFNSGTQQDPQADIVSAREITFTRRSGTGAVSFTSAGTGPAFKFANPSGVIIGGPAGATVVKFVNKLRFVDIYNFRRTEVEVLDAVAAPAPGGNPNSQRQALSAGADLPTAGADAGVIAASSDLFEAIDQQQSFWQPLMAVEFDVMPEDDKDDLQIEASTGDELSGSDYPELFGSESK